MIQRGETVIGENDSVVFLTRDRLTNARREELELRKSVPDQRGGFALDLIRQWGMVSARRGADTGAGRPTVEALTPAEVVDRAFELTERAWDEMKSRGWLVELTRPEPAADE